MTNLESGLYSWCEQSDTSSYNHPRKVTLPPHSPGNIKDPVPLTEMSRASCPDGRFPPSFIHHHRTE